MIRALTSSDISKLRDIHSIHFADQFNFPDFSRYLSAFVVEDDFTGQIVTAGGIRSIAECVLVTDMSLDPKTRIKALYQMLNASIFVCNQSGHDQIYVWSRDIKYTRRLKRNGFRPSTGDSLILDL